MIIESNQVVSVRKADKAGSHTLPWSGIQRMVEQMPQKKRGKKVEEVPKEKKMCMRY
jgi:hypothetical protein